MYLIFFSFFFFFFNDTATTEIYTVYNTLSLHDALPIWSWYFRETNVRYPHAYQVWRPQFDQIQIGRATSELQSLYTISYAVFCLKKKKKRDPVLNRLTALRVRTERELRLPLHRPWHSERRASGRFCF